MSIPIKKLGETETFLVGSLSGAGVITTVASAASGAWTSAGIFNVEGWRRATLFAWVDAVTGATTAARAGFRIWGSASMPSGAAPTATMDVWHAVQAYDGSVTATTINTTKAIGGATAPVLVGVATLPVGVWAPEPFPNATDKTRPMLRLDVADLRWIAVEYAEIGDTAHPSKVALSYILSV